MLVKARHNDVAWYVAGPDLVTNEIQIELRRLELIGPEAAETALNYDSGRKQDIDVAQPPHDPSGD